MRLLNSDYSLLLIKQSTKIKDHYWRERNVSGPQWGPMSWPRSPPVICVSCLSGLPEFLELHGSPNVLDRFPPNCSIFTTGRNIIVINLAIIEFYYKSGICLWLWQKAWFFVIISSQPAGAAMPGLTQMTSQSNQIENTCECGVCVCVCVCAGALVGTVMDNTRRGKEKEALCTKLIQWSFRNSQEIRWIKY